MEWNSAVLSTTLHVHSLLDDRFVTLRRKINDSTMKLQPPRKCASLFSGVCLRQKAALGWLWVGSCSVLSVLFGRVPSVCLSCPSCPVPFVRPAAPSRPVLSSVLSRPVRLVAPRPVVSVPSRPVTPQIPPHQVKLMQINNKNVQTYVKLGPHSLT